MKWIDTHMVSDMMARSAESNRKRTNHNLHESAEDPVQRYCIAATRDSYFRPQRHPHNWELAIVFRGQFQFVVFDENGSVTESHTVGAHSEKGFEIEANRWHCWIPLTDECAFFEVKPGPYDPATAAEFAPWAREEGTVDAKQYVQQLKERASHG